MQILQNSWSKCTKCEIGKHCRNHVFVDYMPKTIHFSKMPMVDLLFIGEGPGASEDFDGLPFRGIAGEVLKLAITLADPTCKTCYGKGFIVYKYIVNNDGIERERSHQCDVCSGHGTIRIGFTNLLVCRPFEGKPHEGKNRAPEYTEVMNCMERLIETIRLLNPKGLIFLGREPESYQPYIHRCLKDGDFHCYSVNLPHPSAIARRGGLNANPEYIQKFDQVFTEYWREMERQCDPFAD